jgi:hypothetical protein
MPYAVQRPRVQEVDLEVVVALGDQGPEDRRQILRRLGVGRVQDAQVVAPVAAGVQEASAGVLDQPVGVFGGQVTGRVDQEGGRPDAGAAAPGPDRVGDARAGAEAAGEGEPVAEGFR